MTVYKYFGIIRGTLVSSFLQADSPEEKKKKRMTAQGPREQGKPAPPSQSLGSLVGRRAGAPVALLWGGSTVHPLCAHVHNAST